MKRIRLNKIAVLTVAIVLLLSSLMTINVLATDTEESTQVTNGIVSEEGKLWWYVDGEKTYGGLMLIDGAYYYARSNGEILTNCTYWISKTNDLLPAANYTFGEDGKALNGMVSDGEKLWWYVNGYKTYGGLLQVDGAIYYAGADGEILTNATHWVNKTNDLGEVGYYTFGEDGKAVNGIISEDGKLWWYVNGYKTYGGLIYVDGAYYYARSTGELVVNDTYWLSKTNGLLSAVNGIFGADGRMLNAPMADTEEPDEDDTSETEPVTDAATDAVATNGSDSWIWFVILLIVLAAVIAIVLLRKKSEPEEEPAPETKPEPKPEPAPAPAPAPVQEEPRRAEIVEAVSVDTVDELMSDAEAVEMLEEARVRTAKGKMGIINLGVICPNFEADETVTLEALKAKGLIGAKFGRVKILASGSLDKPLTIKADAFSLQAVKMIILTGGHAVKLVGEEKDQ